MKKVDFKELSFNPFMMVGNEWMLVSSGNLTKYNTMTVSWGHFGTIWNHSKGAPSLVVYVRESRYTKEFIDKNEYFSVTVFDKKYHTDLGYLGTHSGRDEDKVSKTKLTPIEIDNVIAFNEAKLTFICKKVYSQKMREEHFYDQDIISEFYPNKDFHEFYIGEIVEIYKE